MDALDTKLDQADRGADPGGAPPGPPVDEAAVAQAAEAEKWIGAALRFGAVGRAMLPDHVRPHWTEDRLRDVGVQLANCARHYGWSFADAITHPLFGLVAAAFPLVWPLAEPIVMPMIKDLAGKKEKVIPPSDAVRVDEPAPTPPANKPPTVAPIG